MAILMIACAFVADAQSASVAVGHLHAIGERKATYTWHLQYAHSLSQKMEGTLTWLNEGHLSDHHRDGISLQIWRLHQVPSNSLQFGIGAGPYHYFDTTTGAKAPKFSNQHGFKGLVSLRAQYPSRAGSWAAFIQLNRVVTGASSPQTQALLAGARVQFGERRTSRPATRPADIPTGKMAANDTEIALLFGRTILNSFKSETTAGFESFAIEYRQGLSQHLAWSVAYCDEGGIDAARKDGVAVQGWLVAPSADRKWLLAFGAGPYIYRVFPEFDRGSRTVNLRTSLRYSMMVGHHLGGHWGARLQWSRTLTRSDQDTDALIAGVAYLW